MAEPSNPPSLDIVWGEYEKRQKAQDDYEKQSMLIHPQPRFVVKSRFSGPVMVQTYAGLVQTPAGCKVFVNVCSHPAIALPHEMRDPVSAEVSLSAPSACSDARFEKDHEGADCLAFDVVFHPSALDLAQGQFGAPDLPQELIVIAREMCLSNGRVTAFRDFVVEIALSLVERRSQGQLDYEKITYPRLKFKGSGDPPPQRIRRPGVTAEQAVGRAPMSKNGGALIEEVVDGDGDDANGATVAGRSSSSGPTAATAGPARAPASVGAATGTVPASATDSAAGSVVFPVKLFCKAAAGDADAPRARPATAAEGTAARTDADGDGALELYSEFLARCTGAGADFSASAGAGAGARPGLPPPPEYLLLEVRDTHAVAPGDVRVAISGGTVTVAFAHATAADTSASSASVSASAADTNMPIALSRRWAPVVMTLPFTFRAHEATARVVLAAAKVVVALPVAGYAPVFAELARALGDPATPMECAPSAAGGAEATAATVLSLRDKRVMRALLQRVSAHDAALARVADERVRWREREHAVLRQAGPAAAAYAEALPADYWDRAENKDAGPGRGGDGAGGGVDFEWSNPFVGLIFG